MKHEATVLIVGSGGREHAIAWKIAQSKHVKKVYVAPGNAGTALEPKVQNVDIDISDPVNILRFALPRKVDLTIVGPDQQLANGIVDVFENVGLRILGPRMAAAKLETSKTFAKDMLIEAGVNTAPFVSVTSQDDAEKHIRENYKEGERIVIKADGLALGKGVFIKSTINEAIETARKLLVDKILGSAGDRVVIEKFIEGIEVSLTALVSGHNIIPFELSQDYKKLNASKGAPNTGGMGAYSPIFEQNREETFSRAIILPVIRKLLEKNILYKGFLYAGLVVDKNGVPHVLEFNARLGDPEAEVLLMRLKSDFYQLCRLAASQELDRIKKVEWDTDIVAGVILASGGYPGTYKVGLPITGLSEADHMENTKVFHCGTKRGSNGEIITNGGRVLMVCGKDKNLYAAAIRAYVRVSKIEFDNMDYRKDIGHHLSVTV